MIDCFSKRRTMPVINSPFLSLNSWKVMSRSASRIFWITTCFAVWAAMRPSSSVPMLTLKPKLSPIMHSESCSRASSSEISTSSLVTSSTTVLYS